MVANIFIYTVSIVTSCVRSVNFTSISDFLRVGDFLIDSPFLTLFLLQKHKVFRCRNLFFFFSTTIYPFGHTTLDTWHLPVESWVCRVFQDMVNLFDFSAAF